MVHVANLAVKCDKSPSSRRCGENCHSMTKSRPFAPKSALRAVPVSAKTLIAGRAHPSLSSLRLSKGRLFAFWRPFFATFQVQKATFRSFAPQGRGGVRPRVPTSGAVMPSRSFALRKGSALFEGWLADGLACGQMALERAKMVGMTGFEPATSCSQSRRATRLRHIPTLSDRAATTQVRGSSTIIAEWHVVWSAFCLCRCEPTPTKPLIKNKDLSTQL